jgi:hypothetical protein
LHIEDCDGSHLTADDAVRALDDAWKKKFGSSYKKNSPKIARLATERRIEDARQRAKQQHRQKEQRNPHQCLPCVTDLYHLIDAINVIRSESTSSHQFPISD